MPLVLQPIDQAAKVQLAQQLACWAKTANGMTDPAVQFGTCCVSPTGQTLGRWTIPDDLCTTYGALPFTGNNGQVISCPPTGSAEYMPYYIYDDDVDPINVTTCTPLEPLATPTALTAGTPTDTSVLLSWEAVTNADGYTVSYSADGGVTWTEVDTATNSAELTGLTPETTYTARVRANDSTDTYAKSDWTATVTFTTAATPLEPLAAPTALTAGTPTATEIPLSWDAVADADGYTVEYSDDGGATWTPVTSATNSTTLTGLTASTEYTIRVMATDSTGQFGDSPWSATITASTTA